jgi:hypothetical protein
MADAFASGFPSAVSVGSAARHRTGGGPSHSSPYEFSCSDSYAATHQIIAEAFSYGNLLSPTGELGPPVCEQCSDREARRQAPIEAVGNRAVERWCAPGIANVCLTPIAPLTATRPGVKGPVGLSPHLPHGGATAHALRSAFPERSPWTPRSMRLVVPIDSFKDWERLAPPKGANQWLDGRSAMELARAWCGDGAPGCLTRSRLP